MKKILTILLLFIQTSCSSVEIRMVKKHKGIDPSFKPYIEEFKYLSRGKVKDKDFEGLSIGFRDYAKNVNTVGTCHYTVFEIDINKKWWNSYYRSFEEKYELIFHELGHCVLKRGHTEIPSHNGFLAWLERIGFRLGLFSQKGYLKDGCPASIMHPYTLSQTCMNRHYYYYINELFGNDKKNNYVESKMTVNKYSQKSKCPEANVVNKTKEWTEQDVRNLKSAHKRCPELYGTCLKTFIKNKTRSYYAICK